MKVVYPRAIQHRCPPSRLNKALELERSSRWRSSDRRRNTQRNYASSLPSSVPTLPSLHPPLLFEPVKLVMMGSSRNAADEARIANLRSLCTELGLEQHVEFLINADFAVILERLRTASVGLSTMKDEHFGINVVEFMAAGLVTLSHRSAGPWLDIAFPSANCPAPGGEKGEKERAGAVGYHAEEVEEFANVLAQIFDLEDKEPEKMEEMRRRARERAQKVFGREAFVKAWQDDLWSKLEAKLLTRRRQSNAAHRRNLIRERKGMLQFIHARIDNTITNERETEVCVRLD